MAAFRPAAQTAPDRVTANKRRGPRTGVAGAKKQVTLRIDPHVNKHYRATGDGWQGRINAALRKAAGP